MPHSLTFYFMSTNGRFNDLASRRGTRNRRFHWLSGERFSEVELCVKLRSLRLRCIAGFWVSVAMQNFKERTYSKYRLKVNADCFFTLDCAQVNIDLARSKNVRMTNSFVPKSNIPILFNPSPVSLTQSSPSHPSSQLLTHATYHTTILNSISESYDNTSPKRYCCGSTLCSIRSINIDILNWYL